MTIILKLMRIKQWVKNLFILLPLFFSGSAFDPENLRKSVVLVIGFCFIASSVYIINDLIDSKKDKDHPGKKDRPIASGKISLLSAIILLVFFLTLGFSIILTLGNTLVVIITFVYLALNILYSLKLKNLPSFDLITLSLFYVIRVLIGGVVIGIAITNWLSICTFTIALFLGAGKRYIELYSNGTSSRMVLEKYTKEYLLYALYLSSFSTIVFYSLFCFTKGIYYELSIFPVVGGFLMYFLKLFRHEINEDPSLIFLRDKSIAFYLIVWAIIVFSLTYIFPSLQTS